MASTATADAADQGTKKKQQEDQAEGAALLLIAARPSSSFVFTPDSFRHGNHSLDNAAVKIALFKSRIRCIQIK